MVGLPLIGSALRQDWIRHVAFGNVTWRGVLLAVVGPVLFLLCGWALAFVFVLVIRPDATSLEINNIRRWLGFRIAGLWQVAFILLLAPLPEEFFWRGFVYTSFKRRLGRLPAGLSQAVLFGLFHLAGGLFHVWSAFLYGLCFWCVYERSRSLVCAMVSHVLVNCFVVCLVWWGGPPGPDFMAEVLEDLAEQMRDPEVIAAQREMDEAAKEPGPEGIAKLIGFLGDSRSAVSGYATAEILFGYGEEASPYLQSALVTSVSSVQQSNLISALELLGDPSAVDVIAPFINSDSGAVRYSALTALISFGAVDHVVRGLESERSDVRQITFALLRVRAGWESLGYDPALPPEEQPEAIARWRSWLEARKDVQTRQ